MKKNKASKKSSANKSAPATSAKSDSSAKLVSPKLKTPSIRTFNIHGSAKTQAWEFSNHLVPPMTASTTFRLKSLQRGADGFQLFANIENHKDPIWIYDRLEEPSSKMLEEQLAQMERGEVAISFSSGMGAISASFLAFLKAGDTVISHKTLYGCTYSLITSWLPRFGVNHQLVNINQLKASTSKEFANLLKKKIKVAAPKTKSKSSSIILSQLLGD